MPLRPPAVAGTFYPGLAETLRRELDGLIPAAPKEKVLAVIVPHAGYVYSGRVAGAVYARIDVPQDVVLLCFNHRGFGPGFSIWPGGAWRTPLGDAPVNSDLARRIKNAFQDADYGEVGFLDEHSGEVQVPFLQRLRPDVRIAPVALSVGMGAAAALQDFGRALARVDGDFLVVGSTDLNHYEDQQTTLAKDQAVIQAIEALDVPALAAAIRIQEVSMCGFAPTIATIAYARAKGAAVAKTVMHATSGDVSGDYDRVVGYAGMIIPCGN
ncbi:MAG TPA: AmmeMemoRadiSam system protein B [Planctomycetota bacterium]|nr:AmmeMemoRadiSam system protein B [Planctomycetota bacterium]